MMRAQINQTVLELVQGDITQQDVDAIVNAANSSLLGGSGVDGAIHRSAGSQLLEETRKLKGCKTGDAKITRGYKLKARHVVHTVGPVYQANDPNVPRQLSSAYRRSLEVALENSVKTIAFPAISTGVYSYPLQAAAEVALSTVCDLVRTREGLTLVRFVLFDTKALQVYEQTLKALTQQQPGLRLI